MIITRKLIEDLTGVPWSRGLSEVQVALLSLGASFAESAAGRSTYTLASGLSLDVYVEQEAVSAVEVVLEVFENPELLSPEEYEDKIDEFFGKYQEYVSVATAVLGPPAFNDGMGNERFPVDEDALWLALWDVPCGRFTIQEKHEDRELPIRILIAIRPA